MTSFLFFRSVVQVRIAVGLLVVGAFGATVFADSFQAAYPYAVTSSRGMYVFKMIPSTDESARNTEVPSGAGVAYVVTPDGKLSEIWQTSGWYARQVFLGTDGHTLVRVGPWNVGSAPSPNHLAIAFYRDGKLLKSYSTAELIKDRSKIAVSASHYEWMPGLGTFAPGIGKDETGPFLDEGNHTFTLTTIDDRRYQFDTDTGEIKRVEPNVRALFAWASPEELERVIVALTVAEFPISAEQAPAVLGLPARSVLIFSEVDDDFEISYFAVTDPADRSGYYAVRKKTKLSAPGRGSTPGEFVAIDLVFQTAGGTNFVVEPDKFPPREVQRMKADRKARDQTPKEFSEAYLKKQDTPPLLKQIQPR